MTSIPNGLNAATDPSLGSFTDNQNRAILIAGLACSCISLAATLITLRWFILMKRLFRHRLVLYLILSDTFKALWYFIFPIVVFTRGPVQSSSAWCQTSGWLLAFGIESSDFAILLIALHAMLYIFKPQVRIGKGGLYKYRKWTPLVWLGPPAIMASLAFLNNGQGYVTAGTFCYLPKRPIWYRLALTYIPRYIILLTIFGMFAAISIYVHVKFRSFKVVVEGGDTGSELASEFEGNTSFSESVAPDELVPPISVIRSSPQIPAPATEKKDANLRPGFVRGFSFRSMQNESVPQPHSEPWDAMNFITSKPLQESGMNQARIQTADFALTVARGSASSEETRVPTLDVSNSFRTPNHEFQKPRQVSDVPTVSTSRTENSYTTPTPGEVQRQRQKGKVVRDPLQLTRIAIRNQLRFLFIYPAAYALMWAFPFATNCTLYSDYYAAHPIFWLQIISTCCLSLQAAVDCLVFSWREKPWRRVDESSRLSIPFWRQQSVILIKRMSFTNPVPQSSRTQSRKDTATGEDASNMLSTPRDRPQPLNWWEEEGKKRKDSVWMGTDLLSKFTSKQSDKDKEEKMDAITERSGSV